VPAVLPFSTTGAVIVRPSSPLKVTALTSTSLPRRLMVVKDHELDRAKHILAEAEPREREEDTEPE